MSKDTIYREDAIKAINARTNWYQVTCNGKQIAVMLMAKDVNETLEKVPPADRPQGEWIRIECNENIEGHIVPMRIYKCSTCGEKEVALTRFCPNCGADMRGKGDEHSDFR